MAQWNVRALRTGSSTVDQSMLTYLSGMGTEVRIPHICLLLTGPSTVLVDTGFGDPDVIAAAYPQELFRTPKQNLIDQLRECGVSPADVEIIVHTHLHYDHVGNSHLFPRAVKYAHAAELSYAAAPAAPVMHREYFAPSHGFPPQFDPDDLTPITADQEIAPGLDVVHLPGHTPGSVGIVATTRSGPICFAGDLIMVRENLVADTPVGLHVNIDDCERSRQRVLNFDAEVIPSHDMRIFVDGDIRQFA